MNELIVNNLLLGYQFAMQRDVGKISNIGVGTCHNS
jgi:hypothetical protein